MLKKLKEALKKAGLPEELANSLNITSEDEIEGVIKLMQSTRKSENVLDFEKVLTSDEFTKFVEDKGFEKVIELSKSLQSGHDKKVTSGIKTFKEKYFKDIDPDGEGKEGKTEETNTDDVPEWAKPLIKAVNDIQDGTQKSDKLGEAREVLKKSKLPEKLQKKWEGRIDLESDTSFEDQVKALEEEHTETHQEIVGDNTGEGLPLGSPTGDKKPSEAQVEELADGF